MTVDDEVGVGRLFVLADSRLDQGRVFQGGEAKGDVLADFFQRLEIDDSFAIGGIEVGAASVVGDFESATIASGDAVAELAAVVGPDGEIGIAEASVSLARSEEKDVLLRGSDQSADRSRKQS